MESELKRTQRDYTLAFKLSVVIFYCYLARICWRA